MSFILDALKKSEAERQRQAGPALLEVQVARPTRRWPLWGAIILTLLIANGVVLTWLALRKPSAPLPAEKSAVSGTLARRGISGGVGDRGSGSVGGGGAASSAAAVNPYAPAVVDGGVVADNPADQLPALPPETAPSSVAGVAGSTASAAYGASMEPPAYETLSANLPDLQLNLHVFADTPAARYALINMHKVHEGDVLPEGPHVLRITPTGVVLDYQGSQFVLNK